MGFIACPTQSVADVMTERLGAVPGAVLGAVLNALPGAIELLVQRVVAHALRARL